MKLINRELINILNMLDNYSNKKLPQKISYAITRNIILLGKDYECYDRELKKLLQKYDDYIVKDESNQMMLDDNGFPILEKGKSKDFHNDLEMLLNIEIDITFYTISIESFDYDDHEKYDILSVKDIIALQSILCIDPVETNTESDVDKE